MRSIYFRYLWNLRAASLSVELGRWWAAGASWSDVLAGYAQSRPQLDASECFKAALGDMWFRVPSLRIADGHQRYSARGTYVYVFEWSSPLLGAAHALDLMVFGNGLALPFLAGFKDYADTAEFMRKAWVAFAKSGNPQVAGIGGRHTDSKIRP